MTGIGSLPHGGPRITKVIFVPFGADAIPNHLPLLERKRRTVWASAPRNGVIVELAAGLAARPRRTLRRLGVETKTLEFLGRVRPRVVVMAESAEQAWNLAKLLRGWYVSDAIPGKHHSVLGPDVPDEDDDPPPGRIATLTYAARYGVECDVLVRGTAGTGKLNWDSIRGRGGRTGTMPEVVVDLDDGGDERSRMDSHTRHREYREQGLVVLKPQREQRIT